MVIFAQLVECIIDLDLLESGEIFSNLSLIDLSNAERKLLALRQGGMVEGLRIRTLSTVLTILFHNT